MRKNFFAVQVTTHWSRFSRDVVESAYIDGNWEPSGIYLVQCVLGQPCLSRKVGPHDSLFPSNLILWCKQDEIRRFFYSNIDTENNNYHIWKIITFKSHPFATDYINGTDNIFLYGHNGWIKLSQNSYGGETKDYRFPLLFCFALLFFFVYTGQKSDRVCCNTSPSCTRNKGLGNTRRRDEWNLDMCMVKEQFLFVV